MLERTIAFLGVQACAVAHGLGSVGGRGAGQLSAGDLGDRRRRGLRRRLRTEHITFDADGTFRTVRGEQPTATGFWHLVEDVLDLHMVSSPAFFDDPDDQVRRRVERTRRPVPVLLRQGTAVRHRRRTAFAPSRPWATCYAAPTITAVLEADRLLVRASRFAVRPRHLVQGRNHKSPHLDGGGGIMPGCARGSKLRLVPVIVLGSRRSWRIATAAKSTSNGRGSCC